MRRWYHLCRVVFAVLVFVATTFAARASFGEEASAPSGTPAPSASAAQRAVAEVRVREKTILAIRASRAERGAAERAKAANAAIEVVLSHPDDIGEVRYEETQGSAVVYVGKTPIVTLGPDDVEASGEASLAVLATQTTHRL